MKSIFNERYRQLVGWIIAERKFKKVTQVELSKRLGYPNSTYISKIEQFERRMDMLEFVNICEIIGINPHDGLSILLEKTTSIRNQRSDE
jgi:transcriptional regulator with XRE-family HTH domain